LEGLKKNYENWIDGFLFEIRIRDLQDVECQLQCYDIQRLVDLGTGSLTAVTNCGMEYRVRFPAGAGNSLLGTAPRQDPAARLTSCQMAAGRCFTRRNGRSV